MDPNSRPWTLVIKCLLNLISALISLANSVFDSNLTIRNELAVVRGLVDKENTYLKEQLAQSLAANNSMTTTLANSFPKLLESNQSMQRELRRAEREIADLKEQLRMQRTPSMTLQPQQREVADQTTQTETEASPTTLAAIQQTLPVSALLLDKMDCFKRDGSADTLNQFQQLFVSGVSERLGDHAHVPVELNSDGVLRGCLVESTVANMQVTAFIKDRLSGARLRGTYPWKTASGASLALHFKTQSLADEYVSDLYLPNDVLTGISPSQITSRFVAPVVPYFLGSSRCLIVVNIPPTILRSEDNIANMFECFRATSLRVVGRNVRLEMATKKEANCVFKAIHDLELLGCRLQCNAKNVAASPNVLPPPHRIVQDDGAPPNP